MGLPGAAGTQLLGPSAGAGWEVKWPGQAWVSGGHAAPRRPRFCRTFLPQRRPGCPPLTERQSRGATRTRAARRGHRKATVSSVGPGVCCPRAQRWALALTACEMLPTALSTHTWGCCVSWHLNVLLYKGGERELPSPASGRSQERGTGRSVRAMSPHLVPELLHC